MAARGEDGLARASFLILLALSEGPAHGLGLVGRVEEATHGQVKLGPGTLYGTLQTLLAQGLVRDTDPPASPDHSDPRRRYYRLTPRGDRALRAEATRLRLLVKAAEARQVLGDL